jgi:1-aminocyclopropane-1-carboxylate deaminase
MQFEPFNIPLQAINDDVTRNHGIQLFILRTDLNHPYISGNKLFKLKYNLIEAEKNGIKTLLTFGGAFSNHIAATAAAGKEFGFKTIGIIRGEEYPELNPTLQFAMECGMEINYVARTLYRDKVKLYDYVSQQFSEKSYYLIPEGGSNEMGVKGCKEITGFVNIDFDYVCCACGTGATMAGIILSLKKNQKAIGFQVLKAKEYIKNEVEAHLEKEFKSSANAVNMKFGVVPDDKNIQNSWSIDENYHFGGYAKSQNELIKFVDWFKHKNQVPLDYIYTGKMMFGIYDLIGKGFFKRGETIVAIHTGGLQGNAGMVFLSK